MSKELNILSTKKLTPTQLDQLNKYGIATDFDIIDTLSVFDFIEPTYPNIIFSSYKGCQYGLKALGESAKNYKYHCVGEKSKELLEKNNLTIISWANYSKELTDKLLKTNNFTYITGSKRLNTIPSFLIKNNLTFEEIISYKSEVSKTIPKEKQDAILWFSPAGINAYYAQNKLSGGTQHYCIGNTTKKALIDSQPSIKLDQINSLEKHSTDDLVRLFCNNTLNK